MTGAGTPGLRPEASFGEIDRAQKGARRDGEMERNERYCGDRSGVATEYEVGATEEESEGEEESRREEKGKYGERFGGDGRLGTDIHWQRRHYRALVSILVGALLIL
jgi:hypothetical protein